MNTFPYTWRKKGFGGIDKKISSGRSVQCLKNHARNFLGTLHYENEKSLKPAAMLVSAWNMSYTRVY